MKSGSYILWLELERFYAGDHPEPLVVIRDEFVLDANDLARKRGIENGISLRQAKALLHGGVFKTWQREDYEQRARAWLDLCVEFTGGIEPADQHCAWLDLSLHPNPVDVAERLIRDLIKKTRLKVRYGAGPSKWVAQLAAMSGDCGQAIRAPAAFLAGLPVALLLPVLPEHRERLGFLGYGTIGSVAALPLATLQAQFGNEGLRILSAATGALAQAVVPQYPPSSIAESIVFDGPVDNLEMLHQACNALAQRVGERLSSRGLQSGKLRVRLEMEDGLLRSLTRVFTKPLRCQRSVYAALRLLLDPVLRAPVCSIRLFIPDLVRVRQFQPNLIETASRLDSQRVVKAMQHVQAVFGDHSVLLGNELQLPRRAKVLREWKHATGWR